jgi:hypothetical protein
VPRVSGSKRHQLGTSTSTRAIQSTEVSKLKEFNLLTKLQINTILKTPHLTKIMWILQSLQLVTIRIKINNMLGTKIKATIVMGKDNTVCREEVKTAMREVASTTTPQATSSMITEVTRAARSEIRKVKFQQHFSLIPSCTKLTNFSLLPFTLLLHFDPAYFYKN